jgi:starch synthase
VLRHRARVLHGILNGVDYAEWNPAADGYLPVRYDLDDLRGKSECKRVLQAELGLAVAAAPPLLVMISRFAEQKGMDVLLAGLPTLMTETDAQVGILGNGDPQYEERVRALAAAWPGRISARIGFDERLAHRLEAGGDVFLMPSRYEPCGLNQLYSLRYGTLPVVHATGGLDDTVIDADDLPSRGTGFKFNDYSAPAFVTAVRRALVARDDAERWRRLVRNAMVQDFSWRRSAQAYARLYASLPAPPAPPF